MSGHGMVLQDHECDPQSLTTLGTVTVSAGKIEVEGFESGNASTCRQLAAQSIAWAIEVLSAELVAIAAAPGGGIATVN